MDVTGLLLEYSGRLNSLESQSTFVNQQLLQRPALTEFSQFQNIWNRQITELSNLVTITQNNIKVLQQLYVNLNMLVASNYAVFTGHTGNFTLHNV